MTDNSGTNVRIIKGNNTPERLDIVLRRELPYHLKTELSNSFIRKLIFGGCVRVNGKVIKSADAPMRRLDRIDIRILPQDLAEQTQVRTMQPEPLVVLFEDAHLLAVDKPSGIPTHPTIDKRRVNLFDLALNHLKQQTQQPDEVYLGIHHRLDKDTSGVVLFSKSQDVNPQLSRLFSDRMMQKTYIAICDINGQTPAPDRWTIDNHMGEVGKRHGKSVYGAVKSGGDRAVTEFEVIERSKKILAVFARPKTGRTHQIRAHLLSCGLPIIGDQLYHPALAARRAQEPSQRLMLHAFELAFPHPVDGRQLSFRAPIPPAFVSLLPRMAAALKGSPDLTNPMDLT